MHATRLRHRKLSGNEVDLPLFMAAAVGKLSSDTMALQRWARGSQTNSSASRTTTRLSPKVTWSPDCHLPKGDPNLFPEELIWKP